MPSRLFPAALMVGLLLAVPGQGEAQDFRLDQGPRNAVYLELAGNAFLYSVNLERRVERWWGRVGFGYALDLEEPADTAPPGTENQYREVWGVPVMVGTLFGTGPHYFETGFGLTLAKHPDDSSPFVYGSLALGYRYFSPNSGLMFRAGVAPFFDWSFVEDPGLWPALSIGWKW